VPFVVVKNALDESSAFSFSRALHHCDGGACSAAVSVELRESSRRNSWPGSAGVFLCLPDYCFQTAGLQSRTRRATSPLFTVRASVLVPLLLAIFWDARLTRWI